MGKPVASCRVWIFSYTKKLYANSFYEFFKCYPRRYHRSKKIQQN